MSVFRNSPTYQSWFYGRANRAYHWLEIEEARIGREQQPITARPTPTSQTVIFHEDPHGRHFRGNGERARLPGTPVVAPSAWAKAKVGINFFISIKEPVCLFALEVLPTNTTVYSATHFFCTNDLIGIALTGIKCATSPYSITESLGYSLQVVGDHGDIDNIPKKLALWTASLTLKLFDHKKPYYMSANWLQHTVIHFMSVVSNIFRLKGESNDGGGFKSDKEAEAQYRKSVQLTLKEKAGLTKLKKTLLNDPKALEKVCKEFDIQEKEGDSLTKRTPELYARVALFKAGEKGLKKWVKAKDFVSGGHLLSVRFQGFFDKEDSKTHSQCMKSLADPNGMVETSTADGGSDYGFHIESKTPTLEETGRAVTFSYCRAKSDRFEAAHWQEEYKLVKGLCTPVSVASSLPYCKVPDKLSPIRWVVSYDKGAVDCKKKGGKVSSTQQMIGYYCKYDSALGEDFINNAVLGLGAVSRLKNTITCSNYKKNIRFDHDGNIVAVPADGSVFSALKTVLRPIPQPSQESEKCTQEEGNRLLDKLEPFVSSQLQQFKDEIPMCMLLKDRDSDGLNCPGDYHVFEEFIFEALVFWYKPCDDAQGSGVICSHKCGDVFRPQLTITEQVNNWSAHWATMRSIVPTKAQYNITLPAEVMDVVTAFCPEIIAEKARVVAEDAMWAEEVASL